MRSGKEQNAAPAPPAIPGRSGASTIASLLVLLFGGGAALVIASLFLTGLAQREILPRLRQRTEHAVASATRKVKEGPLGKLRLHGAGGEGVPGGVMQVQGPGSPPDSAAGSTPRDSLEALCSQIETERVFLVGERNDLGRMRAGIDSALSRYGSVRDSQLVRQAKLLAGMRAEEAARVLDAMDDATVSSIVGRMNSRAASKVLPRLDARRVARLSMAAIGAPEPVDPLLPTLPVTPPPSAQ